MNVFDKKIFNDCAGFGITETTSFYLTIEPVVGTETLLGKQVSELQTGIATNSGEVVGTLNYVIGYTGFSGDPALQSGHFLALKATAQAGTVISATLVGGSGKIVTLDDDGMIVFRITSTTQKVQFMATKDGETYTMTLPLTNIVLVPQLTLTVSAVTDNRDLLGKTASDLQENIVVTSSAITGTSKYVTDYTGFSGDVSEQSGNYIALIAQPNIEGATIVYHGTNGDVTLDSDHTIVIRIINENARQFTATYDGQTVNVSLSISGLTLTPAPQPQPTGLTPFDDGSEPGHQAQVVTGIQFDTETNIDTLLEEIIDVNEQVIMLSSTTGMLLIAFGGEMPGGGMAYMLAAVTDNSDTPTYVYSSVEVQGMFSKGWQNLDANGRFMYQSTVTISNVNNAKNWNDGSFAGAILAE